MAHRELELTLLSARDLKNVNLFTRMDVYAVASISGDPMTRQCTPTDTSGGRNPSWNMTLRFNVPPSAAEANGGWLHVLLRSERALGDRDVGEVVVPLADLLAGAEDTGPQPPRLTSYQVHTVLRGEPRGVLNVSYRLGTVVAPVERAGNESPVYGHPAPQQPFKPEYPVPPPQPPYQYSPPHSAYHRPLVPPLKPQYAAPPQQQYQNSPPHDAYRRPPRHVEALSPASDKSNGHWPTQVYMGPHTQIIFGGGGGNRTPGRSDTIPSTAKEDGPTRPKTYYVSTQPNKANPAKEDGPTWPKQFYAPAQPNPNPGKTEYYDSNWPNASPKKPDHSTRPQHKTKVSEPTHAQSKTGPGKTIDHSTRSQQQALQQQDYNKQVANNMSRSRKTNGIQVESTQPNTPHNIGNADSTRPKEAYATNQPNSTPQEQAADHQSGPKAALQQHQRVPSLPTAAAR